MSSAAVVAGYPDVASTAPTSTREPDLFGVERSPSSLRKAIEFSFYFTLIAIEFPRLGLERIPYLVGSISMLLGVFTLLVLIMERERLPATLWFILGFNFFANISQVAGQGETPILGKELDSLIQWWFKFIVVYYVVQNSSAQKRLILLYVLIIVFSVSVAGFEHGTITYGSKYGREAAGRLWLQTGYGAGLDDTNHLGQSAGFFAVVCLFWSLRSSKMFRPVLWFLALFLTVVLFRTVSRGAMAVFACGMVLLLASVLAGRGVRLGGLIMVIVLAIGGIYVGQTIISKTERLEERLHEKTSRFDVYRVETLYDLWNTKLMGQGTSPYTSAGITAHNAFIFTHMAFGGLTAWTYVAWWIFLSVRVYRMMRARDYPLDRRLFVLCLFGMALGAQLQLNYSYMLVMSIIAAALVEKYTMPYGKHQIQARNALWYSWPYPTEPAQT